MQCAMCSVHLPKNSQCVCKVYKVSWPVIQIDTWMSCVRACVACYTRKGGHAMGFFESLCLSHPCIILIHSAKIAPDSTLTYEIAYP